MQAFNAFELTKLLDNILPALTISKDRQEKKLTIVKRIFDYLKKTLVSVKYRNDVLQRIIADFSSYDNAHLMNMVDYFIEGIRKNDDECMSYL